MSEGDRMNAVDVLTKNPWPHMPADAAQAGMRVAMWSALVEIEALERDRGGLSPGAITLRKKLRRMVPGGYDGRSCIADRGVWEARATETDARPFPGVTVALLYSGLTKQEQDRSVALVNAGAAEVVATGEAIIARMTADGAS